MSRRAVAPPSLVDLEEIRARCAANAATAPTNETPAPRKLAPDRHPQQDFFLCSLLDVSPKDDRASMEHALYALSKKPDTVVRKYERVKVVPSVLGRPTVWDKDVILFAIAQLVAAQDAGETISRTIRMRARDVLVYCNRGTGGHNYALLVQALERLTTPTETRLGALRRPDYPHVVG